MVGDVQSKDFLGLEIGVRLPTAANQNDILLIFEMISAELSSKSFFESQFLMLVFLSPRSQMAKIVNVDSICVDIQQKIAFFPTTMCWTRQW